MDRARDIEPELRRASRTALARLELLRALHRLIVIPLALLTVPLWLLVAWPALLEGAPRVLLLTAWAIALGGVVAVTIAVTVARRRHERAEAALRALREPR